MKCICKNCKHCLEHPDGKVCGKHLVFVHKDDTCEGFETDELLNPKKIAAFAIIIAGIVIILLKIL